LVLLYIFSFLFDAPLLLRRPTPPSLSNTVVSRHHLFLVPVVKKVISHWLGFR